MGETGPDITRSATRSASRSKRSPGGPIISFGWMEAAVGFTGFGLCPFFDGAVVGGGKCAPLAWLRARRTPARAWFLLGDDLAAAALRGACAKLLMWTFLRRIRSVTPDHRFPATRKTLADLPDRDKATRAVICRLILTDGNLPSQAPLRTFPVFASGSAHPGCGSQGGSGGERTPRDRDGRSSDGCHPSRAGLGRGQNRSARQ